MINLINPTLSTYAYANNQTYAHYAYANPFLRKQIGAS